MDINQFLLSLLSALSTLEFVEKVDFQTEVFVLKGRVILKKNRFLQVYFNELTGTTAFALIVFWGRSQLLNFNPGVPVSIAGKATPDILRIR